VHGDGLLPVIPAHGRPTSGAEAHYAFFITGKSKDLAFGRKMMDNAPHTGVFHEVGHFLDHQGLGDGGPGHATEGRATDKAKGPIQDLMDALKKTRTSQALRDYRETLGSFQPQGLNTAGLPPVDGRLLGMVKYLNTAPETFARAYSQYVAVKSGNKAALRELRNLQGHGASFSNRQADGASYGYRGFSDQAGAVPITSGRKSWNLPWAWQDDEFKDVEAAFDRLFEAMGWRQ
jgi:hypothetical protein